MKRLYYSDILEELFIYMFTEEEHKAFILGAGYSYESENISYLGELEGADPLTTCLKAIEKGCSSEEIEEVLDGEFPGYKIQTDYSHFENLLYDYSGNGLYIVNNAIKRKEEIEVLEMKNEDLEELMKTEEIVPENGIGFIEEGDLDG